MSGVDGRTANPLGPTNCQALTVTADDRSSTICGRRSLFPQDDVDNEPARPAKRPNRALRDGIRCPFSPALASDTGRPTPSRGIMHLRPHLLPTKKTPKNEQKWEALMSE